MITIKPRNIKPRNIIQESKLYVLYITLSMTNYSNEE